MISGPRAQSFKNRLLALLLSILHLLVQSHDSLSRWCAWPLAIYQSATRSLLGSSTHVKRRGKQPAFPTTVAAILAEEWGGAETLDGLASLIHWARSAGIKKLQIYERAGSLKTSANLLDSRLNFHSRLYDIKVFCSPSDRGYLAGAKGVLSAVETDPEGSYSATSITLFSGEDGCAPLLAAINAGCREGSTNHCTAETLLGQIGAAAGNDVVDQPELVWVFGPVLTLAGFPPWLVRHSEIHSMGSLSDLSSCSMNKALQRYCQTSQRFGT